MAISWEECPDTLPYKTILDGKYEIQEILGRGGFWITYRAYDRNMRRSVAIKEYFPSMLATRKGNTQVTFSLNGDRANAFRAGRESFIREAQTLATFTGIPGIVWGFQLFRGK